MVKTKRDRFLEVASARTNKVLYDIHLLGNCANKNNYEYSDEEVRQMFQAIENEVKETKSLFLPKQGKQKNFSFENKK
jgi:hypothetical protein